MDRGQGGVRDTVTTMTANGSPAGALSAIARRSSWNGACHRSVARQPENVSVLS